MARYDAILALAGALAMTSCAAESTGPSGDGLGHLAVVNTLSATTNAFLDAEPFDLPSTGQSVGFPLSTGNHHFELRSSTGQTLAQRNFTAADGVHQTFMVGATSTGGVALLFGTETSDTASAPPISGIKLRVVHLADNTPDYDSYFYRVDQAVDSGTALVRPFRYGVGTDARFPGYTVRPAGQYRVRITAVGSTTAVIETETLTLAEGQVWSVVLSRAANGALQLQAVRDNNERLQ